MPDVGYGISLVGVFIFLVWIAFVALVVTLLVLAVRWLWRADQHSRYGASQRTGPGWGAPPTPRPDDPLEILRQRYARGEIDDEEYERRRRILTGS
jgi:putative membrane protein